MQTPYLAFSWRYTWEEWGRGLPIRIYQRSFGLSLGRSGQPEGIIFWRRGEPCPQRTLPMVECRERRFDVVWDPRLTRLSIPLQEKARIIDRSTGLLYDRDSGEGINRALLGAFGGRHDHGVWRIPYHRILGAYGELTLVTGDIEVCIRAYRDMKAEGFVYGWVHRHLARFFGW